MPSRQQLDQLVQRNRYNTQAWLDLLKQTIATGVDQDVRDVFQRFTDVFPTAGVHWAKWATYEFDKGHYDDVVSLFTKSLDTVYSVDLYRFYLDYVTKMHTTEMGLIASPESYNTIAQAYEFALGRVGLDRRAGAIWTKYLAFLASQEPQSQWEEQKKLDQLRAAYQRAIMVPTDQLLQIWKDYDTFENTTNRHTAKAILLKFSAGYMTARSADRNLVSLFEKIKAHQPTGGLACPPTWSARDASYLKAWKDYIAWEKSNPLTLEPPELIQRVNYAYRQALLVLRFYPELWIEAALYMMEVEDKDGAVKLLKQATEVLPESCLVHFAYAEHQELLKNTDEVNRTYQQLTTNLQTKLSALASRKEQATQRVGELIQERVQATRKSLQPSTDMAVAQELEARDPDDSQQADTNAGNVAHTAKRIKTDAAADNVEIASAVSPDNDSLLGDEDLSINDIPDPHKDSAHQADPEALPDFGTTPSLQDEIALGANGTLDLASYKRAVDKYQRQKLDRIETRFAERMDPLREQLNMAYIMQLRVVRRSQGSNACREVFNKIFQSDWTTYQTYVAHALIEFYMNKDVDKAALVFKHGMKRFDKSPAFILQYLEYLIRINDVQNAQALFELAVSGIPPEEAKDIWDTYLDYQNQYGDLEATHKLETRYRDAFPQETLTHRLATKYTFQDVAVVAQQDLGLDRLPDERQPTAAATAAAATEQPAVDDKPQGPVLPSKHETAKPHRSWDMPPRGEGRKRLFTSVEPGKYPRPDWSQWVSLRASEAAAVRSTGKNGAGDGGGEFSDDSFEDEGTGSPPASPPGSTTTVNKAGHPLHAKIEDDHHQPQPFQHRPPHHPRSRPGSVDPFSSNPHSPAPSTSMEDPSLALIHTFLKALPPAKAFDGPTFVADAILKRLTKANVPPINPDYSALAMGLKSQPQGRQHPSAGPSGGFMGGGSSAFAESSTSGGDAYHPEPYYDDPGDWRGPPAGDGNAAPPGHDWSRDRTDYREPYRDRRGRYPPSARPPLPPPQPLQQRDPGFRDRNYRGQPSYRARGAPKRKRNY